MKKAAENGVAEAQYALSGMYKNGTGVEKDDLRSLYWLRRRSKRYARGKKSFSR
jgi:TPR repeat protein